MESSGTVKIISPKTGKKITVGKGAYNKLLTEGYTEQALLALIPTIQKVKSPITQRMITVGGKTYKNLQQQGYFDIKEQNLPDDILYNIIINTDPYDLISLYNTNKQYKKILDDKNTLNDLYEKYNIYTYGDLTFDKFIMEYIYENIPRFGRIKYLEVELYKAINCINDIYINYQIKVTDKYNEESAYDYAIKFLRSHGYNKDLDNVDNLYYKNWLNKLMIKIDKLLLSKQGNYTVIPKEEALEKDC